MPREEREGEMALSTVGPGLVVGAADPRPRDFLGPFACWSELNETPVLQLLRARDPDGRLAGLQLKDPESWAWLRITI